MSSDYTYSERQKTLYTKHFLESISRRLSGRREDKGCEYEVTISVDKGKDLISITPLLYVYLDRHRRSDIDRRTILDWVMNNMLAGELDWGWNNNSQLVVDGDCFVPGSYIYKKYEDANYRKWINRKEIVE